jgi:uncharacterized protein (TIGR04376 family)
MALFDDLSSFLEARLEEFLRQHPELELQALEDKLGEQETETSRLLQSLNSQQKQVKAEILATAQEIQRWHGRIEKAQAANRQDLAQAAQEREAALLRQGNQQWGQMEITKQRIQQTETLLLQIQARRQEVQQKAQAAQAQTAAARAARTDTPNGQAATSGWYQHEVGQTPDPLEEQFHRWEVEEELEQLKRRMGR